MSETICVSGYHKRIHFSGELAPAHKLDQPFVKKFYSLFDWNNPTVSFCRLKTEHFLPAHRDHYLTYQKLFNVAIPQTICRCIVFLEDWAPGHYFDIEEHGISNWQAGDYVVWQYDAIHSAGNMGVADRYTVQLTGEAKDIDLFYKLQTDLI